MEESDRERAERKARQAAMRRSDSGSGAALAASSSSFGGGSGSGSGDEWALLREGDELAGGWRVGSKIGEGTFSRIYDAQRCATHTPYAQPAPHAAVVLKVNKLRVKPNGGAAAAAAAAGGGASSPTDASAAYSASFAHEARVFQAVQAAEERRVGRQPPGAPPLPLSVPRLLAYQPHCTPLRPAAAAAARPPDGVEFMVLEKCGVDLSALRYEWQSRSSNSSSSSSQVHAPLSLELGVLCLKALEQFHRAGFVHRDIKPSNFLTCLDPNEGALRIMVTDFGLSRQRGASPAQLQQELNNADNRFIGKSLYASFAAHRHEVQSPRDDVVSLLFVLLDLMYGDLPWKSLATGNATDKRGQSQRWDAVLAEKERLLGAEACRSTLEAQQKNQPPPSCAWLPGCTLPPLMRIIFHELHSHRPDTELDYGRIRMHLQKLSEEIRDQLRQSGKQWVSLQALLHSRAEEQARTAALEARRRAEAEEVRLAEERRAEVERQRAEQERIDREKRELHQAMYRANMEKLKESAAQAERQAQLAQMQQQQWMPAAAQPPGAAARSAAQQIQERQQRDMLSRLPKQPPPFHVWSRRVRDLFGELFQLHPLLPVLDVTSPIGAALPVASSSSSAAPQPSLESLWDRAAWGEVLEAAVLDRSLLKVRFVHWKGDWNKVYEGLNQLSWDQLRGLEKHFKQPSTPLPAPLSEARGDDKFAAVAIAINVAYIYELALQAKEGLVRVEGFGAPAPLLPIKPAAAAATAAVAATPARGGAASGDSSGAATTPVPKPVRLVKKAEFINVDGAPSDVAAAAAGAPPAASSAVPPAARPSAAAAATGKPAFKKSDASKPISTVKPELGKAKVSAAAAQPSSIAAAGVKKPVQIGTIQKKLSRVVVSSSESSSSGSDSSSSSDSDNDEPLVVKSSVKPPKPLGKLKLKKLGVRGAAAAESKPKRRLKKLAASTSSDDEDHGASSEDEDEGKKLKKKRRGAIAAAADDADELAEEEADNELAHLTTKSARQKILEEVAQKRAAEAKEKKEAARVAEEKEALARWPGIFSKLQQGVQQPALKSVGTFELPVAWTRPSTSSAASSVAATEGSASEGEVEEADEDKMALRAYFDRFPSTMALWAWGDDYAEWTIHMRDMLNRAMVLDQLADMGAVKPKNVNELQQNWRERFDIKDKKIMAPHDDDPKAIEMHNHFLATALPVAQTEAEELANQEGESEEEEEFKPMLLPTKSEKEEKPAKAKGTTKQTKKDSAPAAAAAAPTAGIRRGRPSKQEEATVAAAAAPSSAPTPEPLIAEIVVDPAKVRVDAAAAAPVDSAIASPAGADVADASTPLSVDTSGAAAAGGGGAAGANEEVSTPSTTGRKRRAAGPASEASGSQSSKRAKKSKAPPVEIDIAGSDSPEPAALSPAASASASAAATPSTPAEAPRQTDAESATKAGSKRKQPAPGTVDEQKEPAAAAAGESKEEMGGRTSRAAKKSKH